MWTTPKKSKPMTTPRGYYRNSHGAVLVYDSSKKDSLNELKAWVDELNKQTNRIGCTAVCALWGKKSEEYPDNPVTQDDIDGFQGRHASAIPKELCAEVDESNIVEEFQKLVNILHHGAPEQSLHRSTITLQSSGQYANGDDSGEEPSAAGGFCSRC